MASGTSFASQDTAAAPGDRRWLILVVVAVAQLMVVLDATIVNIALPSAQRELGFSERRPAVGGYCLRARVRKLAACRRPDRRHVQPEMGVYHGSDRIRAGVRPRRRGRSFEVLVGGAGPARSFRRPPRAVRAGHARQHVPGPARARPGLRGVRLRRRRRRRDRADPRRRADPVPVLALVPLREPAVRRARGGGRAGLHPQPPASFPGRGWTGRAPSWPAPGSSASSSVSPTPRRPGGRPA